MGRKRKPTKQPFQFKWEVPTGGYECIKAFSRTELSAKPVPGTFVVESTPFGVARTVRRDRFLTEETGLFLEFAKLGAKPESIARFACDHGLLGRPLTEWVTRGEKGPVYPGEKVSAWFGEISLLRRLLPLWDEKYVTPTSAITFKTGPRLIQAEWRSDDGQFGTETFVMRDTQPELYLRLERDSSETRQYYLRAKINTRLLDFPSTARLIDRAENRFSLFIVPSSLIAAIWLQFARAVDGNRQYRSCKNCGRWFEIGGDGSRSDAETCTDSCRAAASKKLKAHKRGRRKQ